RSARIVGRSVTFGMRSGSSPSRSLALRPDTTPSAFLSSRKCGDPVPRHGGGLLGRSVKPGDDPWRGATHGPRAVVGPLGWPALVIMIARSQRARSQLVTTSHS